MDNSVNNNNDYLDTLSLIKQRYASTFLPFFNSLGKYFSSITINSRIASKVKSASYGARKTELLIKELNSLLDPEVKEKSAKVNKVRTLMSDINEELQEWTLQADKDMEVNTAINIVFDNTKISLKHLTKLQPLFLTKFSELSKEIQNPSLNQRWKTASPETQKLAASFGKSALMHIAGPFGVFAQAGIGVVKGIYERSKEKKRTLEDKAFKQSVLTEEDKASEAHFNRYMGNEFSGFKGGFKNRYNPDYNEYYNQSPENKGRVQNKQQNKGFSENINRASNISPGIEEISQPGTSGRKESFADSLFHFYNVHALKATWTKRVLDALENMSGKRSSGEDKKGGFLETLASMKILLPGLLTGLAILATSITWVLGIAAAGLAGLAIGKFINGKMPAVASMLPSTWIARGLGNLSVGANPFTGKKLGLKDSSPAARQLEFQSKGMSRREAALKVIQERQEVVSNTESITGANKTNIPYLGENLNKVTEVNTGKENKTIKESEVSNEPKNIPLVNKIDTKQIGNKLQTVPLAKSSLEEAFKDIYGGLKTPFEEIVESLKEQKKVTLKSHHRSGTDAWGIKDPLLSGLSFGTLEIS